MHFVFVRLHHQVSHRGILHQLILITTGQLISPNSFSLARKIWDEPAESLPCLLYTRILSSAAAPHVVTVLMSMISTYAATSTALHRLQVGVGVIVEVNQIVE